MTTLPITEVTVLEDRAHVVRSGELRVDAGATRIALDELAPVLVDKTLVARTDAPSVRIVDVSVERRTIHLAAERDADFVALEADERALHRRLEAERTMLARIDAEIADLDAIAARILDELGKDVAYGIADLPRVRAELASAHEAVDALVAPRAERATVIARLERAHEDLLRRIDATGEGRTKDVARIVLAIEATEAASIPVRVEYIVPGVAWRPQHRATLRGGRLAIATDACVWQHTGEDWTDAALRFSTERPSLGASPPSLDSDVLRSRKREEQVHVAIREQVIEDTGLGRATAVPELLGIDDGGEPLALVSAAPMTIPSDGRPHRVPIAQAESDATTRLVVIGERVPAVVLRSEQDHTGRVPILAGPVELVRESGIVGRTSTLFIAPGERFELGFGPESALRVHREVSSGTAERSMLSSWQKVERVVRVTISNLGPDRHEVLVRERVPVSEIEKFKAALVHDRCRPTSMRADANGFVDVPTVVEPFGHTTVELVYTVEKHDDVVGIAL